MHAPSGTCRLPLPLLSLALVSCVFVYAMPALSGEKKAELGWVLNQSMPGIGDCTIYLKKNVLRLDDRTRNCTLVVSADGKLVAYSTAKRMTYESSLKEHKGFVSYRIGGLLGSADGKSSWVKGGEEKLPGITTVKYLPVGRSAPWLGYWVAPEIAAAKPLVSFVCRYFDLADCGAIPIRCVEGSRKRRIKFSTASVMKQTIASTMFSIPSGYKKVKDLEIIMFDQDAIKDW